MGIFDDTFSKHHPNHDGYDDGIDDVVDYMAGHGWAPKRREKPRCHHCGMRDLNWQQVKGSTWRLHDGRTLHECLTKQSTADGFDDEPIL